MPIVEIQNITKRFNDKLVLDNISFNVEKGEILGLIGPNGAGKSTLINIISNIIDATNGTVSINGFNIKNSPIDAKKIIGVVPQSLALLENVSAYRNLEFFGSLYGLKGSMLKSRIEEVLNIIGLYSRRNDKVIKFSGGMKRRLNIGVAILHKPKVLIMDEPTVGVDPQSRNYIFDFCRNTCSEDGTAIIYTSHYMEEIEELCSKIFIIDNGKEIAHGTKDEINSLIPCSNFIQITVSNINSKILFNLSELSGVNDIIEEDKIITLSIKNNFNLSSAIKIIERDSHIIKINYLENKLENIFLNLTGKDLRA